MQRQVNRYINRAQELLVDLDHDRLEQEMLILAQKMDVEEEIDRLKAHIGEVENVIRQNHPVGRRLDFLMQEMNREANTIAAKANHAEISHRVVFIKEEVERLREQVQNIE